VTSQSYTLNTRGRTLKGQEIIAVITQAREATFLARHLSVCHTVEGTGYTKFLLQCL